MAQLPPLPEGQEWVAAADLAVGDVIVGEERGLDSEVRRIEPKPRQVWITVAPIDDERTAQLAAELGVPLGIALMQRQQMRPSRDMAFAVRR